MSETDPAKNTGKDVEDYAATALDPDHWSNEIDQSDRVHELVDQSEWVIYNWRHLKVLEHTDHFDAYEAVGGLHPSDTSVQTILTGCAYYAMVADVESRIARMERD